MSRKPDRTAAMLSIAETITLCAGGMDELRRLLFGRTKERRKQRT